MKHIRPYNLLYIDIETVSNSKQFSDLDETMQGLFAKKTAYQRKEDFSPEEFYDRAGIWAEFGKIVCISIAYLAETSAGGKQLRFRSFYDHNEKDLLIDFVEVLENFKQYAFCGHNIKEFDLPFICRRMLVHGIALPDMLNLAGKKPWEIHHIDTL
ncbi:MAG: 3'-5' exonuclease, partial [Flavobacteriales bacterium]